MIYCLDAAFHRHRALPCLPFAKAFLLFSVAVTVFVLAILPAHAQRRPREEKPQVLAQIPEAPSATRVSTSRLGYLFVPPPQRGLLSRQVEDSLKEIRKLVRKRRLVRITAWVGGAGDVRRVSTAIREQLGIWRIAIPPITVIRVGALPNPANRVVFEVEVEEENQMNPHGLMYLAGVRRFPDQFHMNLQPDLDKSVETLIGRLREEGADESHVLSVRCFVSLNEDLRALHNTLRQRFPAANTHVMQALRSTPESFVNCEMVARLAEAPQQELDAKVVTLTEGEAPITSLVKVNTPQLIVTAGQLCFRATDEDLALGFERLENTLEELGTSLVNAAHLSILAQSPELGIRAEQQGRKFLNVRYDPAILRQTIEALPALDSTISLDAVVALPSQ